MADSPCDRYQTELTALAQQVSSSFGDKMKALGDTIKGRADELQGDAPDDPGAVGGAVGATFNVDWADVSIKFDLPEFRMETQEWSFDVPQVTMKDQEIIFHTPSVRMKTVKVGQKPEFGPWGVKWTDITMDIPEPFMQEQRIVMGVPEFRVDRTSVKLDVPEVEMKTHEIILGLPQFTLVDVHGEFHDYQARAEALKDESESQVAAVKNDFVTSAQRDIGHAANTLFSCLRTQIQNRRAEALASLDPAITMLRDSQSKFSSINSDEARGKAVEIGNQLQSAIVKKADMDKRFETTIAQLVEQEKAVVNSVVSGLTSVKA